ncbi:MAG: VWA domain-containing protein [Kiritimatiellae bacterium]|nr:VWA domain-containing protein [Kiritimatiellia bacterium]
MTFAHPEWLPWLLLLLPLGWLLVALVRRRQRALLRLADAQLLPELAPDALSNRPVRRVLWLLLALLCTLLALARPQWGVRWEEVTRKGLDIAILLDTSRSMTATDLPPSRLQQAKWGIRDLLASLNGDRVALIPFAGASVLQCPFTTDYAAFLMTLDDIYAGIIPKGGTAIQQALQTAIDSFPAADEAETDGDRADRIILLVTDGEDHVGDPLSLVPSLNEAHIRVYTIGIATLAGEIIPAPEGSSDAYFKDRQGRVVQSVLHEDMLQKLALSTGGTYVRSAPGDTGLERLFRESIASLHRTSQEARETSVRVERYPLPLLLGLLCLLLAVFQK